MVETSCDYCGKKLEIYSPIAILEMDEIIYALVANNVASMRVYHKKCWKEYVRKSKEKRR